MQIPVQKGISVSIEAIIKEDGGILLKKGEDKDITQTIQLPNSISAPIFEGQHLGEIVYSKGNDILLTAEIVAKSEVKKMSFGNVLTQVYQKWFTLNRSL